MTRNKRYTTMQTQKRSVVFPTGTLEQLDKLASKSGWSTSSVIREAVDKYLDIQSYTDNIDLITNIIRQELDCSIKNQTNRLAALINRLTIISAAGYYTGISTVADLIDRDRYSSFEKIENLARRKALLFANSKNGAGIRDFLNDEAMEKIRRELTGAPEKQNRKVRKSFEDFDPVNDDPNDFDFDDDDD